MEIKGHTIKSLKEGFAKKDFSPEEIFKEYVAKIKKEDEYNAYLTVFEKAGNPDLSKSLGGIPSAIKDNILVEGTKCTAGSKILENYISAYDATATKKLREAGVLFLGKTNMDEFAMGSSTETSAFGPTLNSWDTTRVPGGSSGGSAVAVASDLAVFGLGSDTAGSIRQPASFCGVVGMKPTYGRVSRHGLIAMTSSLDQIGPFTKNVYDAALVLNTITGHDVFDSTTVKKEVPDFTENLEKNIRGLKVGIPKEFLDSKGLEEEVKEKIQQSISKLEELGCEIVEISLPHAQYSLAVYYILAPSEISSNLARFDGIRYGHSSKSAKTLLETYIESREEGFGAEAKRRIMLGTFALSSGYYDAYYIKAQKVRALIKKDFDEAFKKVDLIAGPTSPSTAFKIGEKKDPISMYLSDIYTVPVNLAGLPAISIPCGTGKDSKLPVGFHLMGRPFEEDVLFRAAHQLEKLL